MTEQIRSIEGSGRTKGVAADLISASAVLCIGGALADGRSQPAELAAYYRAFTGYYLLSRGLASRITRKALRQMLQGHTFEPIEAACEIVNQHLTTTQKQALFEVVAAITNADGKIHPAERFYMEIIAEKLGLGPTYGRQLM